MNEPISTSMLRNHKLNASAEIAEWRYKYFLRFHIVNPFIKLRLL